MRFNVFLSKTNELCTDFTPKIQTVLCTADGTLEPPKADSKGKENVDGMMERQCKDPEELWKLSVESFEATSQMVDNLILSILVTRTLMTFECKIL